MDHPHILRFRLLRLPNNSLLCAAALYILFYWIEHTVKLAVYCCCTIGLSAATVHSVLHATFAQPTLQNDLVHIFHKYINVMLS